MNMFAFITYIRRTIKLLEQLPELLISNISNGKPCFLFSWPFSPEIQRGIHPLTWSPYVIFWLWRGEFHIVQTIKIIRDIQYNVLLAIIDLPMFPNSATYTTFHVQLCGILFPWHILSVSTMINIWWWCYNC